MREKITKTCKIHGELKRNNIAIRIRKSTKPHHKPEWIEKICKLCKKEKDKKDYNNKNRFEIRKKLKKLECSYCHLNLTINEFTDSGLKQKYVTCRNCMNAAARKHYRKSYLKDRYGITQQIYDDLLKEQKGVCAICNNIETRINGLSKKSNVLSVDHNHITGKVRGLLCHLCNSAIGKLRDSSNLLRKAADYLDLHNETAS